MTDILEFDATCTVSCSQTNGIETESMYCLYLLKKISILTMEIPKMKYRSSLIDGHLK